MDELLSYLGKYPAKLMADICQAYGRTLPRYWQKPAIGLAVIVTENKQRLAK